MRKTYYAVAAAGLLAFSLPAPSAQAKPAFAGFSTEATATPVKVAIYEPVLPIPSEPQAELDFAYTRAESATGPTATGRASWIWPGDAVGEGCKTFVEQLQLGATGLCSDGYPVQVNSQTPGGPEHDSDEQVPGSVMRTSSSPDRTIAQAGWSPDGDVSEDGGEQGGGTPDAPGLPVPLPSTDLTQLGAAITGKQQVATEEEPAANGFMPEQLRPLVDVGGMSSISELHTSGDVIRSVATSRIADLSLLEGLITADSIRVTASTTGNGKKATSLVTSRVVGLAIAGNQFTVDRQGVHAAGRQAPIEGLPDDPATALEKLGISFEVPQGRRSAGEEQASALLEGLKIVIDTRVLRSQLDTGALEDAAAQVTKQLPDSAGQLKSLVGALFQLSPEVVITTGNAQSAVTTVEGVTFPPVEMPGSVPGTATGGGSVGAGSVGGAGAAPAGAVPPAAVTAGGTPAATDVATQNAAAGLPPLASIPGALLVGGLVLASGVGWWLQRIGGFVTGGAGACSHGLETGIPDLRKA